MRTCYVTPSARKFGMSERPTRVSRGALLASAALALTLVVGCGGGSDAEPASATAASSSCNTPLPQCTYSTVAGSCSQYCTSPTSCVNACRPASLQPDCTARNAAVALRGSSCGNSSSGGSQSGTASGRVVYFSHSARVPISKAPLPPTAISVQVSPPLEAGEGPIQLELKPAGPRSGTARFYLSDTDLSGTEQLSLAVGGEVLVRGRSNSTSAGDLAITAQVNGVEVGRGTLTVRTYPTKMTPVCAPQPSTNELLVDNVFESESGDRVDLNTNFVGEYVYIAGAPIGPGRVFVFPTPPYGLDPLTGLPFDVYNPHVPPSLALGIDTYDLGVLRDHHRSNGVHAGGPASEIVSVQYYYFNDPVLMGPYNERDPTTYRRFLGMDTFTIKRSVKLEASGWTYSISKEPIPGCSLTVKL